MLGRRLLVMITAFTSMTLAGIGHFQAVGQEPPAPPTRVNAAPSPSTHRALLNTYCVSCHNEKVHTAGLSLENADIEKLGDNAPMWEKVVLKVRSGAMPPAGKPRPEAPAYDGFATYLEQGLDAAAAAKPNPGRPAIHRLNRAEYANAIRDLLGLNTEALDVQALLPADDSGYGFDNIADVLSVSPVLLERYMSVARKVSRLAVGDLAADPELVTYDVPRYMRQEERMSGDLPFASRGGLAFRHFFPIDGEYTIRVRLKRSYDGATILGSLDESHPLDVRLDGARVNLFTVGGAATDRKKEPDADLQFRIPVKAGTRSVGVTFLKDMSKDERVVRPDSLRYLFQDDDEFPSIGSVIIGGPYKPSGPGDTPSRLKIFTCEPAAGRDQDEPCARQILSSLARRAYRRPVSQRDVDPLVGVYESGRTEGGFEAGIRMALRAILVSPDFLFRIESDPTNVNPGTAYRISDIELASRLSFFLWSSIPDDQLLDLAEKGQLRNVAVLEQQVRRMLADSRSKSLVTNFAGQWLYLRNVRSMLPDREAAPDFNENLREAFQQETELFFESMLREDRSILDLLNADYTFLNERLAKHYQIPNVYGSHFRRVTLTDERRRGLLGQGSILMVTSYANRTSPVLRGKWLLENILGTPPPPPPPNVPALKDRGTDGKILSMRQQMEQHRANATCASCHQHMDPLGFALENFDLVGKWRTTSGDADTPVDASGTLPDGTKFSGPAELRKVLLSNRERFVSTVAEKLLIYALGRGLEYYDAAAVRKIVHEAAPSEYRWSSVILGIVKSTPFQMRRSRES
jgi:hypothetical protein